MKLAVQMLTTAVIELMDKIHDINEDIIFPTVVRAYYKEGATCSEFPWDRRQRLETERLAAEYGEPSRWKEISVVEPKDPMLPDDSPTTETECSDPLEQDQEGSTMEEPSRTSMPNTLLLTVKDAKFLEMIPTQSGVENH